MTFFPRICSGFLAALLAVALSSIANAQLLSEKWALTDPVDANYVQDGNKFTLTFDVDNSITGVNTAGQVYQSGCKEEGKALNTAEGIINLVTAVPSTGSATVSFDMNINRLTDSTEIFNTVDDSITICIRFMLKTDNQEVEVNFIETLLTMYFDLTAGFAVDFQVTPKERETTLAEKSYGVSGFLCDPDTGVELESTVFTQGSILSVCVKPNQDAIDDGLFLLSIESFSWIRDAIDQEAIVDGASSGNGLTILNCVSNAEYCSFTSILFADFYRPPTGAPTSSPTETQTMGGGEEDYSAPTSSPTITQTMGGGEKDYGTPTSSPTETQTMGGGEEDYSAPTSSLTITQTMGGGEKDYGTPTSSPTETQTMGGGEEDYGYYESSPEPSELCYDCLQCSASMPVSTPTLVHGFCVYSASMIQLWSTGGMYSSYTEQGDFQQSTMLFGDQSYTADIAFDGTNGQDYKLCEGGTYFQPNLYQTLNSNGGDISFTAYDFYSSSAVASNMRVCAMVTNDPTGDGGLNRFFAGEKLPPPPDILWPNATHSPQPVDIIESGNWAEIGGSYNMIGDLNPYLTNLFESDLHLLHPKAYEYNNPFMVVSIRMSVGNYPTNGLYLPTTTTIPDGSMLELVVGPDAPPLYVRSRSTTGASIVTRVIIQPGSSLWLVSANNGLWYAEGDNAEFKATKSEFSVLSEESEVVDTMNVYCYDLVQSDCYYIGYRKRKLELELELEKERERELQQLQQVERDLQTPQFALVGGQGVALLAFNGVTSRRSRRLGLALAKDATTAGTDRSRLLQQQGGDDVSTKIELEVTVSTGLDRPGLLDTAGGTSFQFGFGFGFGGLGMMMGGWGCATGVLMAWFLGDVVQ